MILKHLSEIYTNSNEFHGFTSREDKKIIIEGIVPSSYAFAISSIFNNSPRQTLVVTKNYQKMQKMYLDLSCFVNPENVAVLPSWEMLPYEFVSPSENIERERVSTLYKILNGEPIIIITPVESIIRAIPEKEFFIKKGFTFNISDE